MEMEQALERLAATARKEHSRQRAINAQFVGEGRGTHDSSSDEDAQKALQQKSKRSITRFSFAGHKINMVGGAIRCIRRPRNREPTPPPSSAASAMSQAQPSAEALVSCITDPSLAEYLFNRGTWSRQL
eukprot:NODE_25187_length_596_cov_1.626866.p2 GENE.NODE_25187_length_596_cov_1.626866~~NODE_25187_length_596_cov_1.626866.p2  ORF type:complete len:139 (-),score=34.11 NODE_25187_length_596_cov_1.626866:179-565(-)